MISLSSHRPGPPFGEIYKFSKLNCAQKHYKAQTEDCENRRKPNNYTAIFSKCLCKTLLTFLQKTDMIKKENCMLCGVSLRR
ncbi:hypothetical protein OBV_42080 [Oscillibacter valericigenes Sjm18-20]|nr:hypothetical protein OBV_42080 [Oscillibacter valericigenes Sjm18-20]